MKCRYCGSELTECMSYCETCGQSIPKDQLPPRPTTTIQPFPKTGLYSLKWFNFLIYFALFASAAVNTLAAVVMLTGFRYSGSYIDMSEVVEIEKIFGILSLGFAALAIVARFRLSGFHKDGPIWLIALYIITLISGIVYAVMVKAVLPGYLADQIQVFTPDMIVSIVMTIVNIIYFTKRRELFVK